MMDSKPFRADRSCTYYSFDSLPCSGPENDNRCHYVAYYAFNNVSAPIRQLHRIYDEMNDALIYAEGYFEILNADDETEPNGSIEGVMIKGTFDLQNVDFAYPNGHMLYMTLTCGLKLEKQLL